MDTGHVFVVVLEDRHIDPIITVHGTREGADRRFDAHKASYRDDYDWSPDRVERIKPWIRYETGSDGGPTLRIEKLELEP